MSRISTTYTGIVILDTEEGNVECPAVFDIEGEQFFAEPYTWGASRGTELEISAELFSAQFGELKLTRNMVVKITGEEHLALQENIVVNEYVEKFPSVGYAA